MTATMRSYCDLHWRHGGVSAGRRSDGGCDGCFESGLPLLRVLAEWYIPDQQLPLLLFVIRYAPLKNSLNI